MSYGLIAWRANGSKVFDSSEANLWVLHQETISAGSTPTIRLSTPKEVFVIVQPTGVPDFNELYHEFTVTPVDANTVDINLSYPSAGGTGINWTKSGSTLLVLTEKKDR